MIDILCNIFIAWAALCLKCYSTIRNVVFVAIIVVVVFFKQKNRFEQDQNFARESVRQLNKPEISVRNIWGLKQGTLKIKRANTNNKGE